MSSWRDTTCGVLTAADAGKRITLAGWTDARRDHGENSPQKIRHPRNVRILPPSRDFH